MSHPWMPFYVEDYLGKTVRLSALEHGVYLLLIVEYWQQRGLPTDDATLARIARLTEREWRKVRPIMQTFFDESWRHTRIDEELAKADAKHAKRVEAGQRGGINKAKADAEARQAASKPPSNAIPDAKAVAPDDAMASSSYSP